LCRNEKGFYTRAALPDYWCNSDLFNSYRLFRLKFDADIDKELSDSFPRVLALLVWFLLLGCQWHGWEQRIETQTPPLLQRAYGTILRRT